MTTQIKSIDSRIQLKPFAIGKVLTFKYKSGLTITGKVSNVEVFGTFTEVDFAKGDDPDDHIHIYVGNSDFDEGLLNVSVECPALPSEAGSIIRATKMVAYLNNRSFEGKLLIRRTEGPIASWRTLDGSFTFSDSEILDFIVADLEKVAR